LTCEENPKWLSLIEILKEIKSEIETNGCDMKESFPSEKVLVLTCDDRIASQLEDVLTIGIKALMQRMFNRSLGEKYGYMFSEDNKKLIDKAEKHTKTNTEKVCDNYNGQEQKLSLLESPVTIIQSMHVGQFAMYKILNELKPRYVILYDVEVSAIRQLEVFQANHSDHKLKSYIMMYRNSAEEQAYLSALRKEKEAFEKLMKEKTTMVIPEHREGRDRDGETEINPDLARNLAEKASDPAVEDLGKSSRRGFEHKKDSTPKVIVDMREFRSELPSILHKRGIDIEPVTLEVGDYIITPQMCIERKSISDLIGSLQSGRLYNQATAMTRFYTKPMLLIEFDHDKPFALQGKYYLSRDVASTDLVARLQLLTLHFPKLRILWSPSPHATAELFEELKKGREEPDATKAAAVSVDLIDEYNTDRFNPVTFDFVKKLPGVTTKNIYSLLNRVNSLTELLSCNQTDLEQIIGSASNAEALYQALHSPAKPLEPESSGSTSIPSKNVGSKGTTRRFKSNVAAKK